MANVCSFEMLIKGDEQSVHNMLDALKGEGKVVIGRGIETQSIRTVPEGVEISGSCSWSIYSSLAEKDDKRINLYTACEKYGVNIEIYAEEEGCGIYEHYMYEDGHICEITRGEPFKKRNFNLAYPKAI